MSTIQSQAEEAIAAVDYAAGRDQDGHRRVHAKGVLCRGRFVATPEAARLTTAAHMQGGEIQATVRFSNASSNPRLDDRARDARGMATAFYLPDGSGTDIVAITLPAFLVRNQRDFVAFTRAAKPVFGEYPGPRMLLYLLTHREAVAATMAVIRMKPPESFATLRYNALHAYRWTGPDGTARYVRYSWLPAAGEQSLTGDEIKERGRDYLMEEIHERLAREPVRFSLQVQIAADGDPVDDATAIWPADRERVDVGTLELTGPDTERERGDDILVFDPSRVTEGIELSEDPLPRLRSHAYSISVERRTGVSRPEDLD